MEGLVLNLVEIPIENQDKKKKKDMKKLGFEKQDMKKQDVKKTLDKESQHHIQ